MSLLRADFLATAQTTGISRSARTPLTCSAFSAKSSPSTPAGSVRGNFSHDRDIVKYSGDVIKQGKQAGADKCSPG